jgi:hypothetical protein
MLFEKDTEYHRERARAEMDCAYRATRNVVANAHMRLSALHMERLRALTQPELPRE